MHISKIASAPSPAMCAAKKNAAKGAKGVPGLDPTGASAPAAAPTANAPASITALAQAQAISAQGGRVASTQPFATTGGGLDIRV